MISIEVLQYIMDAPAFWSALGYTVASAMFVGSLVYNGEFKLAMKGMVTILSYAFFILIITSDRVAYVTATQNLTDNVMMHAGEATIIVTSVAYIIGMMLGVVVTSYARKAQRNAKPKSKR